MTNFVPYDELAPSIIATLERHADSDSIEARDAMEALSVLSTIRDSVEMSAPFVRAGEVNVVASSGRFISRHDTVADALAWFTDQERSTFGGFAVIEVDRTAAVDTFRIVNPPR